MKKTLAATITSALVIGAASTTFAAANPFSDVPVDHWSYDAVAELAQEGIIDGYGDGTFRGDRAITRYEMAQMVAKAMAKDNVSGNAKVTLDKLAAEYADELNNLGVRVDALEKKVDNVTWDGELRLRYDEKGGDRENKQTWPAMLRLNLKAQVNDDWSVKGRTESTYKMDEGGDAENKLKRAYAEGPLFGATAQLGKAPYIAANGVIYDDPMMGAILTWEGDNFDVSIAGGTLEDDSLGFGKGIDVASLQVSGDFTDQFGMNAGYYEFRSNESFGDDKNRIWSVGADYNFTDDLRFDATYAKSNLDSGAWSNREDTAYAFNLQYKGAKRAEKNTYGLNIGYYQLPDSVSFDPTWDTTEHDFKGWRLGGNYTIAENIVLNAWYADGESVDTDDKDLKHARAQVEFFF